MNIPKSFFQNLLAAAVVSIAVISMIVVLTETRSPRQQTIDRTDYESVADSFIRSNVFIAKRLGKITESTHIGKGGETGRESYNVFWLVGQDNPGLLNLTLEKDDTGEWYPKEAQLIDEGLILDVPVSRSSGEKWRVFRWNKE